MTVESLLQSLGPEIEDPEEGMYLLFINHPLSLLVWPSTAHASLPAVSSNISFFFAFLHHFPCLIYLYLFAPCSTSILFLCSALADTLTLSRIISPLLTVHTFSKSRLCRPKGQIHRSVNRWSRSSRPPISHHSLVNSQRRYYRRRYVIAIHHSLI